VVHDGDVLHDQRSSLAIRAEREAAIRHGHDPVHPFRRYRGVKVVNLVLRGSLPLENRKSYMGVDTLLRLARGPVFARHVAEVRRSRAPGKAVAVIVGAHSREPGTPSQLTLEMEYVI